MIMVNLDEPLIFTSAVTSVPRSFYRFIKLKCTDPVGISTLKSGDSVLSDNSCKAECLNDYFASVFAHDSIYAKRAYAIAIPSVRPSVHLSVRLSVTRVIHAKTVEVRIIQFSPHSSPIPLVFVH